METSSPHNTNVIGCQEKHVCTRNSALVRICMRRLVLSCTCARMRLSPMLASNGLQQSYCTGSAVWSTEFSLYRQCCSCVWLPVIYLACLCLLLNPTWTDPGLFLEYISAYSLLPICLTIVSSVLNPNCSVLCLYLICLTVTDLACLTLLIFYLLPSQYLLPNYLVPSQCLTIIYLLPANNLLIDYLLPASAFWPTACCPASSCGSPTCCQLSQLFSYILSGLILWKYRQPTRIS